MIHVLLVDDNRLVSSALARCLCAATGIKLAGIASGIDAARSQLKTARANVLGVQLGIREVRFRAALCDLIRDFPLVRVFVYSLAGADVHAAQWAPVRGLWGIVSCGDDIEAFIVAITRIAQGGKFVADHARSLAARRFSSTFDDVYEDPAQGLSLREAEVFRMTGRGLCSKEIAHHIGVNVKTVETYRRRIRDKMGLKTSGDVLQAAIHLT